MYGKVFESMYDGTLASDGPWQALVTFQQLIVLADQDGVVDMTASAISRRTSIPLEIIQIGLEALSKPDPDSRTPDEDGRRIVCLEAHRDWGWQIVNHKKYQKLRSAEERREYLRIAQAERRARLKEAANTVNTCQQMSAAVSTSTHKDTDKDAEEKKEKRARGSRLPAGWSCPDVWIAWARQERPELDPYKTAEKFADFWHSKAGSQGVKLDWFATWRNWVREERGPRASLQTASRGKTFAEIDAENTADQVFRMTGGLMGKKKQDNVIDMEISNGTRPLLD